MLHKIFNIFTAFIFIILLLILWLSSMKVIYQNLKHFGETKTATIIDIDYSRGDHSSGGKGVYLNTMITDIGADTIYGGSQNQYDSGDKVRVNYRGIGGNSIFEVNGIKKGSKYGAWDFLSPILLLFSSFMLYKAVLSFRENLSFYLKKKIKNN